MKSPLQRQLTKLQSRLNQHTTRTRWDCCVRDWFALICDSGIVFHTANRGVIYRSQSLSGLCLPVWIAVGHWNVLDWFSHICALAQHAINSNKIEITDDNGNVYPGYAVCWIRWVLYQWQCKWENYFPSEYGCYQAKRMRREMLSSMVCTNISKNSLQSKCVLINPRMKWMVRQSNEICGIYSKFIGKKVNVSEFLMVCHIQAREVVIEVSIIWNFQSPQCVESGLDVTNWKRD